MARTAMQARPTLYKGIQMRSRMEAEFAAFLDWTVEQNPDLFDPPGWEYEPVCFANERRQYLPDFAFTQRTEEGPQRVYIEVKPFIRDDDHFIDETARMMTIWESEPGAMLMLYECDGRRRCWFGENGTWAGRAS